MKLVRTYYVDTNIYAVMINYYKFNITQGRNNGKKS